MDHSFPGSCRIKKSREFQKINKMGCKYSTPHFILFSYSTEGSDCRLGVTVSSRVGNAVERNRIKRLIREFWRKKRARLKVADYSVIARKGASNLSSAAIFEELRHIFLKKK